MLAAAGWAVLLAVGSVCPEVERTPGCKDRSIVSGAVGKLVTLPCSTRFDTSARWERPGNTQGFALGNRWVLLLSRRRSEVIDLGAQPAPTVAPIKVRPRIESVETVLKDGEDFAVLGTHKGRQSVHIWWFACSDGCKQLKHAKYTPKKTQLPSSLRTAAARIQGRWAEAARIRRCMMSSAGCPELHNENPKYPGAFQEPRGRLPVPEVVRNRIGVDVGQVYDARAASEAVRTIFSDLKHPVGPPNFELSEARSVGGGYLVLLKATRPRAMPLDYALLLALNGDGVPLGPPARLIHGSPTARHDAQLAQCTESHCLLVESNPKDTVVTVIAPATNCRD